MHLIDLPGGPIDLAAIYAHLNCPHAGGEVVFTGVVRDHHDGRQVEHLAFEAYDEMARRQLAAIADDIVGQWAVDRVALVHRTGRVAIGEVCVVVGVSAAHRDAAFAGCRHGIERLKAEVAIWKRETFVGGEAWVTNHP